MRVQVVGAMIVAAGLLQGSGAPAQTPAQAPAYRAPRTKDGKPNLNGIWQAVNEANWDLEGHGAAAGPFWQLGSAFAVPPGVGVVEGGPIPYKPDALKSERRISRTG